MALNIQKYLIITGLLMVLSGSLTASDSNTSQRLNALEQKILTLQAQLRDLVTTNHRLEEKIEQIEGNNRPKHLTCAELKVALDQRLEELHKLGLKDSHPDVINIIRRLESIKREC